MKRHTIFISDLHLSANRPSTTKLLEKFVAELPENTDAIYVLGDVFQYWAGDDDRSEFNEYIKCIFKKIAMKADLYLMVGNRDFLLGEVFAKECNATLLSDPSAIDLYGKTTLLTHGDILCTKDFKYTTFRKTIRFPFLLKIFLKLPLRFRLWIASKIQQISAHMKNSRCNKENISSSSPSSLSSSDEDPRDDNKIWPENNGKICSEANNNTTSKNSNPYPQQNTIESLLTKYNSNLMIHGHMHKVEIDNFLLNNKTAKRICLDEWAKKVKILFYCNDHSFEFKTMK